MDVPQWKPQPRHVLNLQGDTATTSKPVDTTTSVPETATNPDEGRPAISSPFSENEVTPQQESEADLSETSKDSFDWIGDDRREHESEYEEAFVDEIVSEVGLPPSPPDQRICGQYTNILNILLMVLFVLCLLIWSWRLVSEDVPIIGSVPIHRWATLVLLTVFMPIWSTTLFQKLSRYLKSTRHLSKTFLPIILEAASVPLSVSLTALTVGIYWHLFFPSTCIDDLDESKALELILMDVVPNVEFCTFVYVPKLFVFFFVVGIVLSLSMISMSTLRSSFQEKSFKNRLIESRFKIYVVDILLLAAKRARLSRRLHHDDFTSNNNRVKETAWDFMFNLPFIIPEQIWACFSTSPYSRIENFHLNLGNFSAAEFSEFRDELVQSIRLAGYETIAQAPPRTDHEAKIMARMIFHHLCPHDRKHLTIEDFSNLVSNETACKDAFSIFDLDRDGTITRSEFRGTMVRIFREQRNLAQSVANTGTVLSILDTMGKWIVTAGLFLFLLGLFGVQVSNLLGITASIVLTMNFIIFDAANKTFHALLFLFVMHPFDVGDRIVIGREVGYSDEDVLTVSHINIQNTVFRRWNGMFVSVPNHVLAAGPLTNLSRGGEQWERMEFTLYAPDQHKLTMQEETTRLSSLRRSIEKFLRHYSRDYYQSFELRAVVAADNGKSDRNLDTIKFFLKVRCKLTMDSQKKWIRHARLLAFIKQAVRSAGVEFAAG